MTVKELIAELLEQPMDMEVRVLIAGWDHNHTSTVESVARDKDWDIILGKYVDPEYVQLS